MSNLASLSKIAMQWLNRFSGWLVFLAIIWLCWNIARIIWLVLAPPQAPNLPIAQLQSKQDAKVNASTALAIFEKSNAPAKSKPANINLTGVMLATPVEFSSAMLDIDGQMDNYRIGEVLKGTNYRLIDVSWNQVIIADASNRQIVIDMPERMSLDQSDNIDVETEQGNIRNKRLSSNDNRRATIDLPDNESNTNTQNTRRDNGAESQDDEEDSRADSEGYNKQDAVTALDKASTELKSNPAGYLSSMGVMAAGDGYEVTEAMPAKIRNRLGLKSGDKVLSVNGQSVGSNPAGDADLLNQVKHSGEAAIEVQRGDQTITLRQQF